MHSLLNDKSVIFFDLGYTLLRPASGNWTFTKKFNEITSGRLEKCDPELIRKARKEGENYLNNNQLLHNESEEKEHFSRYYKILSDILQLNLTESEIDIISHDRTYNTNNYLLYPDAIKVLQTLGKTHRLGILSDTSPSIEVKLQALRIRQYFSFATYSFAVGVCKPDPRMYADALQKCSCAANKTVFIDDRPQNLEGAEKFGISTVLIAAELNAAIKTCYPIIHSLSELL